MTQIAIPQLDPLSLELGSALQLDDDELFELCVRNPELRIERTSEGDLIVMTPAGWERGARNVRLLAQLFRWAERDGRGIVSDSSGGFRLPNGAMRAPDAAWVLASRLSELSAEQKRKFPPLCPDFVIELRSPSDSLPALQRKMEEYRSQGAALGWLIDPEERRVHVYRTDGPPIVLEDPEAVDGSPEMPGLVLPLAEIFSSI